MVDVNFDFEMKGNFEGYKTYVGGEMLMFFLMNCNPPQYTFT